MIQNGNNRNETLNIDEKHDTRHYLGGLGGSISCILLLIRALLYLNEDPKIRKIVKALSAAFIEYEFNKYRDWFREFETQVAASTSLVNFQTRMAALCAAKPMPHRTLSQLFNEVTGKISKDD